MDNTFNVNILTPEKKFIEDSFEAVIFTGLDGELCILKNHMPMIAAVSMGIIKLKKNGEWKNLISDNGFAEVNENTLDIFVNMCEWADNIEQARARLEQRKLQEAESIKRHKINTIGLARTVYGFKKSGKKQ